jgi:hypothetical protein
MTEAGDSTIFLESRDHTAWIAVYSEACLSQKNPGTADVYQRILRDFFLWFTESVGSSPSFFPQLTRSMVEMYLNFLEQNRYKSQPSRPSQVRSQQLLSVAH